MRSANIGDFSFFTSYMSQPKSQLETFRAWAGIDSDISYYLNSHHVSRCLFCGNASSWIEACEGLTCGCLSARLISIVGWSRASSSLSRLPPLLRLVSPPASLTTVYVAGVLDSCFGQVLIPLPFLRQVKQTEDTITLLVEWESLTPEKRKGTAGMSPVLSFPLKLCNDSTQNPRASCL
jgi:hypothetical protein